MSRFNKKRIILGVLGFLIGCICVFCYKVHLGVSGVLVSAGQEQLHHSGMIYQYNENIVNILCMGIDKGEEFKKVSVRGEMGQADAIYLISIDKVKGKAFIVNIPRDTIVPVEEYYTNGKLKGVYEEQITLQHAYGGSEEESCIMMAESVSRLLYDLPIHRYCALDYSVIPQINDSVGGVDLVLNEEHIDQVLALLNDQFREGNAVHLNGEAALQYLKTRDITVYASTEERTERQSNYIRAFANKAKEEYSRHPFSTIRLFKDIKGQMQTDLGITDVLSLASSLDSLDIDLNVKVIKGQRIKGIEHEEYYVDDDELIDMLSELYYVPSKGKE